MAQENQLAKIVAPNIESVNYSSDLRNAFDAINSNFKKLATAPFLQGVKGDSYTLVDKQIWKEELGSWVTTTDGELLLKSIFGTPENLNGNTFTSWRNALPLLNGVSPIDFFIGDNNDLVNNTLYFQVIINDSGEEEHESQIMGQLYYFVDARLKEIGYLFNQAKDDAYVRSQLNDFTDATGFYRYEPEDETHEERYVKLNLLPTIYYDSVRNDICWKFGGIKTGISAVGAPGMKGENASLNIVEVEWDGTSNNSDITAIANFDNGSLDWERDSSKFEGLLSGNNALIFLKYEGTGNISGSGTSTNTTHYHYAFGNVYKDSSNNYKAWWFSDAVIEDAVTAKAINVYLMHLGINYGADHNQFIEFPVQPLAAQIDKGTHRIGSYIDINGNIGSLIFNKNSEEEGLNAIFSGYHEIELKTYGSTGVTGVRFYEPANGTPYAKYKESGFEYGAVIGGTNQYQVIGSVDSTGIVIGVKGATEASDKETIKISPDGYTIVNPKLVIGSSEGSTARIEMSEEGATFGNTVDVIKNINAHSDIVLPEQGDIHFDDLVTGRIGSILSSKEIKTFGSGSGAIATLRIVGDPNKTYKSSSLRGSLLEIALGGTSFDYSDVGMRLSEVVNTTDNNEERISIKAVSNTNPSSPSSVDIQTPNFLLCDSRGRKRFVVDYSDTYDTFESTIKVFEPLSNDNLVSVKNSYIDTTALGGEKITRSRVLIDPDNRWSPTVTYKNYADWNFGSDFDNKNSDNNIVGIRLQRDATDRKVIIAPCLEIQGGTGYRATAIIPFIKGDTEFRDNIIVNGRIGCGSGAFTNYHDDKIGDEKIVCEGSGYFTGTINASEGYVMKYNDSFDNWGFIPFSSNTNIITPAPVKHVGLIAYNPNQSSLSVQMKNDDSKESGEIKICRSHTSTIPQGEGSGTYLSIRNEYTTTENNTYIESKSVKNSNIYIRTGVTPSQSNGKNYIHILGDNDPRIILGSDAIVNGCLFSLPQIIGGWGEEYKPNNTELIKSNFISIWGIANEDIYYNFMMQKEYYFAGFVFIGVEAKKEINFYFNFYSKDGRPTSENYIKCGKGKHNYLFYIPGFTSSIKIYEENF